MCCSHVAARDGRSTAGPPRSHRSRRRGAGDHHRRTASGDTGPVRAGDRATDGRPAHRPRAGPRRSAGTTSLVAVRAGHRCRSASRPTGHRAGRCGARPHRPRPAGTGHRGGDPRRRAAGGGGGGPDPGPVALRMAGHCRRARDPSPGVARAGRRGRAARTGRSGHRRPVHRADRWACGGAGGHLGHGGAAGTRRPRRPDRRRVAGHPRSVRVAATGRAGCSSATGPTATHRGAGTGAGGGRHGRHVVPAAHRRAARGAGAGGGGGAGAAGGRLGRRGSAPGARRHRTPDRPPARR